jgi:hypothetical protein
MIHMHRLAYLLLCTLVLIACNQPSLPTLETQILESQKLVANDGNSSYFGTSSAIDGDLMVIGAPFAKGPTNLSYGAAYIYQKDAVGSWQFVKKLFASDATEFDRFGWSVGISGNTIVVGAWSNTVNNRFWQGAAYVFERHQGGTDNWGEVKQLLDGTGARGDHFGYSVAINGDTIVVSAPEDRIGFDGQRRGSVSIYSRNAGGSNAWGQIKKRVPSDGEIADLFGYSLAISDNTIVVGAFWDDIGFNTDQGSAYILEKDRGGNNNWGISKKLIANDGAAFDNFGHSVGISGNTVVVGANYDDVGSNNLQGSAYIFERNQGGTNQWGQVKKLIASDGKAEDIFGQSVAIDGDTIVVSIPGFGNRGAAYLFKRNAGGSNTWGLARKLFPSDGVAADEFGRSAAIDGNTIVVGSHLDNVNNTFGHGSAYVFVF